MPYVSLLGMLLFAGGSFFFALAESALFSLGKWRAQQLADRSPERGKRVLDLLESPQVLLATIVLGNTLANGCLVGIAFWIGFRQGQLLWVMAIVFLVILVGCEVVPKTLAVRAPEQWSMRLVRPVCWLQQITRPLHWLAQRLNAVLLRLFIPRSVKPQAQLTDAEYQELLEMAYLQGALAKSEKEIILQIISLDRKTAKDVMNPRTTMACISDDLSLEEMAEAARKFKHRRLPIYDETPDTIVGVLNTRAFLLDPGRDLAESIEFPSFVPETMNLLQLFKSLQRQRRGLAIVLDEFGGTAGLVTMEDILEEVVGELHGAEAPGGFVMERLGEGRWRVSGLMRLDDFRREYPDLADVPEVDTMGGMLCAQLGVVPVVGESATIGGLRLTATAADERRVTELLAETIRKRG